MTRAYFEDTDRLGLGRPDAEPLASGTIEEIVELIEALIESGHAYESGGDVYFRVAQLRRLRQALQPQPRGHGPGRGGRDRVAEGGPARLRALEGEQGGRGHVLGLALGQGPARLAHRVLGDGRGRAGHRRSRSTAGGSTFSSPTTRTRSPSPRRRAACRWRGSGCTTGWSSSTPRRCRSRTATSSSSPRRSTASSARRSSPIWSPATTDSRWPSPSSCWSSRPPGSSGCATSCASRAPREARGRRPPHTGSASSTPSPTTSTPRRRSAEAFDLVAEGNRRELPGAGAALVEMLELLGLETLARPEQAPDADAQQLLAEREGAREERDFERADDFATSSRRSAGRFATAPRAPASCAAASGQRARRNGRKARGGAEARDRLRAPPGGRGRARPARGAQGLARSRAPRPRS